MFTTSSCQHQLMYLQAWVAVAVAVAVAAAAAGVVVVVHACTNVCFKYKKAGGGDWGEGAAPPPKAE